MAHSVLDRIQIASPCTANWADMDGDERSRHCAACGLRVYHLAAMTADEAAALVWRPGRTCVRLWRRADGTVLTADCPEGRRVRRRRRVRRTVAAATIAAAWTVVEIVTERPRTLPVNASPELFTMGVLVIEPRGPGVVEPGELGVLKPGKAGVVEPGAAEDARPPVPYATGYDPTTGRLQR